MNILTRRISLLFIATTCIIIATLFFSSISNHSSKPLVESSKTPTPESRRINENTTDTTTKKIED